MSKRYALPIILIVLLGLVAGATAAVVVQWQGSGGGGGSSAAGGGGGSPWVDQRWLSALRGLWPAGDESGTGPVARSAHLPSVPTEGGGGVIATPEYAAPVPTVPAALPERFQPGPVVWAGDAGLPFRAWLGTPAWPDGDVAAGAFAHAAELGWSLYQQSLWRPPADALLPAPEPLPVPEPATPLLWLAGLAALVGWRRG